MRFIFNFPDIGEGLDEGTIAEWYVEKGQTIKAGDPLVKMETDKVVTDIPSPKSGVIVARFGKEGETIQVGTPLVEIEIEGVEGEAAQEEAKKTTLEVVEEEGAGVVGTLEVAGNTAVMSASDEGVDETSPVEKSPYRKKALATPVARAMAREMGIDINKVKGTGPGGRVMIEDIKKYAAQLSPQEITSPEPVADKKRETIEPLSQIRKTIARNMLTSKQNIPHMAVHEEVEISELIRIRARFKEILAEEGIKLSYLPFIIKATAKALMKYPSLNARMDLENNQVTYYHYVNMGLAVDTEKGLVVPVIRDADTKSVTEIARELQQIAEKARNNTLTLDDMQGGTFTITNYGSIGGIFANPVINYPQSAILGVGRILKKPMINDQNEVVAGQFLPLSLAVDHRIVDGGNVARFLNQLMFYLSEPSSLILD